MSELSFVERPFLNQLKELGWRVIDQGLGIPEDPSVSLRSTFREVILKDIFKSTVRKINVTADGQEWLTDRQLEELYDEILHQPGKSLLEANEDIFNLLLRTQVDRNDLTGEEDPDVKLIDWHNPSNNSFIAINQFRVDTPGCVKKFIIPDIVLLVNGLPLVVVECKYQSEHCANPMYEAYRQLRRYSGQREETAEAKLAEGEPRLFHCNQLLIRTDGEKADFGSITCTEEYYFAWRSIWPDKYQDYEPPLGKEREQEQLIQGMLPPETLLDIVRHYNVYMETGAGQKIKVLCRYQQYRACSKIVERLKQGKTPTDRSGVVWHTQGSGKSLTMVFVIRKIRTDEELKDYKVLLVNDRIDLENQLGKTAKLAENSVNYIQSTEELKAELSDDTSNLNMVLIHKFHEDKDSKLPEYAAKAIYKEEIPTFEKFGVVNSSDRILIMIDEAHRSQANDLANNLIEAFPNATRIGFTGTPLLAEHYRDKFQRTIDRFGEYIDKYKLRDAVEDGATLQILYEGKTADTAINEKHDFDTKFEDLFKHRTDEEILAIKKKYGTEGDILESENRIEAICLDLVDHYVENILPSGFKAQVVCNSKLAATRYKTYIDKAVKERLAIEKGKVQLDDELIHKLELLRSIVVISTGETNELAIFTETKNQVREWNGVENFTKPFNFEDPEKRLTGIAFLVVCDMLLTGFDAPIEQVMYIDKKVKEHNLLQTIARVNRVYKGKSRGYIVDYIGLANHITEALKIYNEEDVDDLKDSLKSIQNEIPILEERYNRLIQLFEKEGIERIDDWVNQNIEDESEEYLLMEDIIEKLENLKLRADFEVYFSKFILSLDIVLPNKAASRYKVPAKRFGHLLFIARQRYQDRTISLGSAGEKVKKLINQHVISLGINPKIPPIELLSDGFLDHLEQHSGGNSKAKASAMEHALRKHYQVNMDKDPEFYKHLSEKLDLVIAQHKDNWNLLLEKIDEIRQEAMSGRTQIVDGLTLEETTFHEMIYDNAFGSTIIPDEHEDKMKQMVCDVVGILRETIGIVNFWDNAPEVQKVRGKISDKLIFTDIAELIEKSEELTTEIVDLAKNRNDELLVD